MNLELILGLLKIGLEVYQGEKKDEYLKKYNRIKKEFMDEKDKGKSNWSDLTLIRLLDEANELAELLIRERNSVK